MNVQYKVSSYCNPQHHLLTMKQVLFYQPVYALVCSTLVQVVLGIGNKDFLQAKHMFWKFSQHFSTGESYGFRLLEVICLEETFHLVVISSYVIMNIRAVCEPIELTRGFCLIDFHIP